MPGLLQQLLGDNSGERMLRDALQMSQRKQAAAERKEVREQSAAVKMYEKEQKRVSKIQSNNLKLAANPTAIDKLITQNYLPISPSIMKPKDASKYFNQTDMLDASMPEDHPQKGRASAIKEVFTARLTSEEGSAKSAMDILKETMSSEAQTVREDAYRYKREADATSGLLTRVPFFFEGEDESVRKLAGYDEWLETQRKTENTRFWNELPEDVGKTLAMSTVIGAGAGLTVGALGGGLPAAGVLATMGAAAGTAVMPVVGTAIGGAIGAAMGLLAGPATGALVGLATGIGSSLIFDAAAIPAAKILEEGEWYNANMGGTTIDKGQAMVAQFGIGLAGGIASTKIAKFVKELGKAPTKAQKLLGYNGETPKRIGYTIKAGYDQPAIKVQGIVHEASDNTIHQGFNGIHTVPVPFTKPTTTVTELFNNYNVLSKDLLKTVNKDAPILKTVGAGEIAARKNPLVRQKYGQVDVTDVDSIIPQHATYRVRPIAITEHAGKKGIKLTPEEEVSAMLQPPQRAIPEPVAKKIIAKLPPEEQKAVLDASLHPKTGSVENALVDHIDTKKIFKSNSGKEIEYQVSSYDGTIEPKAANEIYKTLTPKEQAVVRKMAQESGVGDVASGVKEVLKQREAKTVGSFVWKEKVKARIDAGKEVPRVHKLRATMEDFDIMKVTEMQAAGKLTVRQADLLSSGKGLGKIKNAEAERILKKFGYDPTKIMSISALAVGSTLLAPELFGDQAEAGILTNLSINIPKLFAGAAKKATTEAGKVAYTKDMIKINQIIVENSNPRMMPTQMMQQFDVAKYATEAYGSVVKSITDISGKTRSILGKPMSPGFYGDLLTKAKGHVAVQLASLEATVAGNSGAVMKVYNNIAEKVPGLKGNSNAVIKEMEELSVRYADDVAPYAEALKQISVKEASNKGLKDILGVRGQKLARDAIRAEMEKGDAEYARLLQIKENLAPNFKKWNAEVNAKHKDLAAKYPGTRIALAAEDTAAFDSRPWLKDMLSKEEVEAVNYIKDMKSHYGKRIEADGHQVFKNKPYVHHPLHPAFAEQKVVAQKLRDAGLMPGEGTPLTKFFTRAKVSKQLVPDIDYVMQKYIPDAEKRIAYSRFWNGTKDASGNVVDEGWKSYSSQVRHLPGHKEFWQGIEKAMTPAEAIPLYQWANRYYQYEVINMIGGSVSAALKHLFKLEGTIANFGLKETIKHFPEANRQAARLAREYLAGTKLGKKAGFTVKEQKTATDELVDSFLSISRHRQTFAEMELDAGISQVNKSARYAKLDKILKTAADAGSFPIKYVEWIDRAHSVLAIRDLALSQSKFAAKKGMTGPKKGLTAFDASYQTWDTMIKMNFMGGSLNPTWQRNPAVRTLFMFQNTPAKLLERRLVNALKSKDAVVKTKDMVFKGYEQQYQALNELQGAMRYIKAAENTFKAGVYQDAIGVMESVQTATGQAYYKQFLMDVLISGGIIAGGGQLFDADLKSHVFHFPFLKAHSQEPTVSLAPIVTGAYKTLEGQGEDPDDMFITRFIHNWQGKKGFVPQTFNKLHRITENDIPEVYKGSWLKHLFSIPARKEH